MNKIDRIKELVNELNQKSLLYYNGKESGMSDAEFDLKFEELQKLEKETGYILSSSPTKNVGYEVITDQEKVKHVVPMLSLNKCHSAEEVINFANGKSIIGMFKMDGISLRATYDDNGDLIGLESRGDGETGSDLYYQRYAFDNLPLHINVNKKTIIDGEAIINDFDFEKINSELSEKEMFTHARNLAAGSLALLDTNISSKRHLKMIVWDVIEGCDYNLLSQKLDWANDLGFDIVYYLVLMNYTAEDIDNLNSNLMYNSKEIGYGIDGVVYKFNDVEYGKSLGRTEHHFNCGIAWKPEMVLHETTLSDIVWQTSKTGLINPVAVFDEIDLEGALTTRATLHNISYIEDLELGIGDIIQVYRANMVIPKVHDNLTRSNTWKLSLPSVCPECGSKTEIHNDNGSKTLHCVNVHCPAQKLGKFIHFSSKKCMNIDGLSEATLSTFMEQGWLNSIKDILFLYEHKDEMEKLPGFGKKSTEKILQSIENASKDVDLYRFVAGLSIYGVGVSTSKDIAKYCHNDFDEFYELLVNGNIDNLTSIEGIGDKMVSDIKRWCEDIDIVGLEQFKYYIQFKNANENQVSSGVDLSSKIFVITGSLNHFSNRDELKDKLESLGAKVASSVSAKTTALINNDVNSTSGKNKKAKELSIPIWSEEELLKLIE